MTLEVEEVVVVVVDMVSELLVLSGNVAMGLLSYDWDQYMEVEEVKKLNDQVTADEDLDYRP